MLQLVGHILEYSTKLQFKNTETFSVTGIITVAQLFIQTHVLVLQRLAYIWSVRNCQLGHI